MRTFAGPSSAVQCVFRGGPYTTASYFWEEWPCWIEVEDGWCAQSSFVADDLAVVVSHGRGCEAVVLVERYGGPGVDPELWQFCRDTVAADIGTEESSGYSCSSLRGIDGPVAAPVAVRLAKQSHRIRVTGIPFVLLAPEHRVCDVILVDES